MALGGKFTVALGSTHMSKPPQNNLSLRLVSPTSTTNRQPSLRQSVSQMLSDRSRPKLELMSPPPLMSPHKQDDLCQTHRAIVHCDAFTYDKQAHLPSQVPEPKQHSDEATKLLHCSHAQL